MKKTGQLLKQKRESENLSLSEVALATKINPKVLTAIENGDEANLPAKTFLKGFVRSYALFLKMDVDEVLRSFVEDTGGPPPAPNHEAYQKDAQTNRRGMPPEGSSGLRTAAIVVIVALICAIIGVRELVDKYQRERLAASTPADVKVSPLDETKPATVADQKSAPSETKIAPPEPKPTPVEARTETKPTPKPLPAPKAKVESQPEAPAPVAKGNVERAPVDQPFESAVPSPLFAVLAPTRPAMMSVDSGIPKALEQPIVGKHEPASVTAPKPALGYHLEDVADTKNAGAESKAAVPAPKADVPAVDPSPAADKAPAEPAPTTAAVGNEVIIEALDRVQVKVQLGADVKSLDLAPNEVHVVRASGPIALDVSDGGAVSLVYNGRVRGVPGTLGEPKQVKIP